MYLYGASGHGKVIKEILEIQGVSVKAFIDDDKAVSEMCDKLVRHAADGLSPIIVSIGNNQSRKLVAERLKCEFGIAIHPSAVVSPTAKIGEGSVVMAGAIINADAVIGRHCIINTGASIDHECIIGDYAHIAPHATLCGQVRVGEGALVGVGASVIPCVTIGDWCTIGAGAAVVDDVKDMEVVGGVPAKSLKNKNLANYSAGWGKYLIFNGLERLQERRNPYAA